MPLALLVAADGAEAAGEIFGRFLLIPLIGLVLLVLGLRRQRDPSGRSSGTVLIVCGAVVLVLGLFGGLLTVVRAS